jgi:hypothetical protein
MWTHGRFIRTGLALMVAGTTSWLEELLTMHMQSNPPTGLAIYNLYSYISLMLTSTGSGSLELSSYLKIDLARILCLVGLNAVATMIIGIRTW